MPANIIQSFASRSKKSVKEVEELWQKAKDIAEKEGHSEDYPYIVAILKTMLKLDIIKSFKEYVEESSLKEYLGFIRR